MTPVDFGQWYYLIYLVPGGAALLTLLFSALGGVRHHRVAHGASHHSGPHVHVHHGSAGGHRIGHTGARVAGTRVAGTRHGQTSNGQRSARHGGRQASRTSGQTRTGAGEYLLSFFGFGRIPAPFVWGSLVLGWSIFGFWATRALQNHMTHPALFAVPAMAAAAGGALLMARLASAGIGRLVPTEESLTVSTVELCGLSGSVAFPVDQTRGRVLVYDQYGTLHDCSARLAPGQPTIARGQTVLVVNFDAEHDQVIVEETV